MSGVIKIFTILFVVVAFFGLLLHPGLLGTTFQGTTSLVKQVQAG